MKRLYYLFLIGIGTVLSVAAVILIIAYQKGKATADKIKAVRKNSTKKPSDKQWQQQEKAGTSAAPTFTGTTT